MTAEPPITVEEAIARILDAVELQPPQRAPLAAARGRVLAETVRAGHNSPPFDTSAMDGFAVRHAELASASDRQPVSLPIQGDVAAGARELATLRPGHALRINTGGPLPVGSDAVVRIEDVRLEGDRAVFARPAAPGTAVRRAGEDYRLGEALLHPGRILDPPAIGLLASLGMAEVAVARRPRVALLATGDELVEPGNPLGFGQIYNSTRHALLRLLSSFGAEVHDLGTVRDSEAEHRAALARGLEFDMLITTGGVSMGNRDLVRPTLVALGVRQLLWRVKQRPGGPLYAGRLDRAAARSTLCLGLPGNPVSVYVTALVYARAAILRMQGVQDVALPWRVAAAGEPFAGVAGMTVFARASRRLDPQRKDGLIQVVPAVGQGSHQFAALAQSDGFVQIGPDGQACFVGSSIPFLEHIF